MRGIALLIAAAGCHGDHIVTVIDSGRACLVSAPEQRQQQFVAGQPAIIQYSLAQCLSSSCDRERTGVCTVSTSDRAISVTSHFQWTDSRRGNEGVACTDDCSGIMATCETDELVDGVYELRFGPSTTLTLIVPSQHAEPVCVDVPD